MGRLTRRPGPQMRHRLQQRLTQAISALAANAYLPAYWRGIIYRGPSKALCVPFLNCYSCPGALGACPVGAFQSLAAAKVAQVSLYVTGWLIAVGAATGRLVCGWLCPFGLVQDLIGSRAQRRKLPAWSTSLRYLVLILTVALPFLIRTPIGSETFFCKYICPAGTLGAGIPLAIANPGIRAALGWLFAWKFALLALLVAASLFILRPFCRLLCPLGALYGLFNPVAIAKLEIDRGACTDCGACEASCRIGIAVRSRPNAPECHRCLDCVAACPTHALRLRNGARTAQGSAPEKEVSRA